MVDTSECTTPKIEAERTNITATRYKNLQHAILLHAIRLSRLLENGANP